MIPYPKKKDTPSRLTRKGARNKVFWTNYKASKLAKKLRLKLARERQEQFES